jgi:thiol-disulfide isomerase/thioredoxin
MSNIMPIVARFLILSLLITHGACSAKTGESNSDQPQPPEKSASIRYKGGVSEIGNVQPRSGRAPNFIWRDTDGKHVTFDAFHSKVTVVNFWATWCGPCRKEIPDLEAIHKEYKDRGVKVIGISLDRGPGVLNAVAEFATKFNMTYPVVIDNGELEQIYGNIRAIPTTFIINKDGKIVERLVGMRSKEMFLQAVLPHLK